MKFSPGDPIFLKHTGEEGVIIRELGSGMVEVSVQGVCFPAHEDEIDHPYLKWFTEKRHQEKTRRSSEDVLPPEHKKKNEYRLATGVYLSFMPLFEESGHEEMISVFKIFLINEMRDSIRFSYEVRQDGKLWFRHQGALAPFSNIYLHFLSFLEMTDQPRFYWELEPETGIHVVESGVLRFRPPQLFKKIQNIMNGDEAVFHELLSDRFQKWGVDFPRDIPRMRPGPGHFPNRKTAVPPYRGEVDLHIEQLEPNYHHLTSQEILDIQLTYLRQELYRAVMHCQKSIVIIHGVGSGVLKRAVHKVLQEMPEVANYKNEWFGKYGFGATEVHFR